MTFSILQTVQKAICIGQEHYLKLLISSILLSGCVYSLTFIINSVALLIIMAHKATGTSSSAIIWMLVGSTTATWLLTPLYLGMAKLAIETCRGHTASFNNAVATMLDKNTILHALGMYALIYAAIMPGPMILINYTLNSTAGNETHYMTIMTGAGIMLLGLYMASHCALSLLCLIEEKKGVIAAIKRSSQLTKKMGYVQVVGTFIVLMGAKIIISRIPSLGWLAQMALEPFIVLIPGLLYLTAQDEQIKTSENTVISGQSISQS